MVFTEPLSVWHLYFPELNGETLEMDKKSPSTSGWVEGVLMFTKNLVFTQLIRGSTLPFCEESEEKHPILTSCPSYSMMVWFGYWVGINNSDEHSQLVPEMFDRFLQALIAKAGFPGKISPLQALRNPLSHPCPSCEHRDHRSGHQTSRMRTRTGIVPGNGELSGSKTGRTSVFCWFLSVSGSLPL